MSAPQLTAERWRLIEGLFHEALAAPEDQRWALLESRCPDDPSLAAEVRSLLAACAAEERATGSSFAPKTRGRSLAGRRVGPYELGELLGRGGVGAVYLASRVDGQFEQQVAIKLVDLPLATEVFRERFRLERQILAGLNHPFIARLLDGGVTEDGELYLVMEHVQGVPVSAYCQKRVLSIDQRLNLFLSICAAVQYAHQSFVVHRDLKPDNILVLSDGTPKLLDFGTAKLIAPVPSTQNLELTREGFHSFTPQYASPEQVLGNPVTTATDTYSLGALLYLLLTGTRPYELKEFSTAEMVRVICHEQPRKPSAVASAEIGKLDADLDAIVLKALRKEPEARYSTVDQLAADVLSYLKGLPVAARQGTFRYRAGKFVRRHRIALAASALLAFSIVAGIGGVLWQSRIANAERRKAEARSKDLQQLSDSLLSELHEAIKQLPGSTPAQRLLVTRVLEHLDRASSDAAGDPLAQLHLADAYTRLANLQGNPYDQNIGDPQGALASLHKAISILETAGRAQPSDPTRLRPLANAQLNRGEVLLGMERLAEALESMRAGAEVLDKLASGPEATAADLSQAATCQGVIGDALAQHRPGSIDDLARALASYQKSLSLSRRALQLDPNSVRAKRSVAVMQMKIGDLESDDDQAKALRYYQQALEALDELPTADQTTVPNRRIRAYLLRKTANTFKDLGDYPQALSYFEKTRAILEPYSKADPDDTRAQYDLASLFDNEAQVYRYQKDPANEIRLLQRARESLETLVKRDPRNAKWHTQLGVLWVHMGATKLPNPVAAEELSARGISMLKELASRKDAQVGDLDDASTALITVVPTRLRDPQLAVAYAERAVTLGQRKQPKAFWLLARAYRSAGRLANADQAAREGLALFPPPASGAPVSWLRKMLEEEIGGRN